MKQVILSMSVVLTVLLFCSCWNQAEERRIFSQWTWFKQPTRGLVFTRPPYLKSLNHIRNIRHIEIHIVEFYV